MKIGQLLTALLFFTLLLLSGCSSGFDSPGECKEGIFKALLNEDMEAFFACVLDPPEDDDERDSVFTWMMRRFDTYLGGRVMGEIETNERVILNISPSPEHLSTYGANLAPPPLALAFVEVEDEGWKFDIEYTDSLKELQDIFNNVIKFQ